MLALDSVPLCKKKGRRGRGELQEEVKKWCGKVWSDGGGTLADYQRARRTILC